MTYYIPLSRSYHIQSTRPYIPQIIKGERHVTQTLVKISYELFIVKDGMDKKVISNSKGQSVAYLPMVPPIQDLDGLPTNNFPSFSRSNQNTNIHKFTLYQILKLSSWLQKPCDASPLSW